MTLRLLWVGLSVILFAISTSAQLPPNQKLPAEDEREFSKELERLETLLATANNKPAIKLQIANTYAAGGRYLEAIQRLRQLVGSNLGFDPSRDPDFAKLQDTAEFRSIIDEVRRQTPPVHNSRLIATLDARDIRPESIAFDSKRNAFILGNTSKFELVKCSALGQCHIFVMSDEKAYVLGVKLDSARGSVWATYNTASGAGLRCYDLETGKLRRTAFVAGTHVFNDLVTSSAGAVYVSDTAEGAIYQLQPGATTPQRLAPLHTFTAANGIAVSADERLLYVSTWEDGFDVIDLPSRAVTPVAHPDNICLAFIDGLYATQRSLIAIQNGPMLPRIAEFRLSENGLQIVGMKVLERRNPAFNGITTGVIVRNSFYYVANPQTDKKGGAELRPLQVFRMFVDR